jgi:pimeloyl-ACP methyl ester carboxylesterase
MARLHHERIAHSEASPARWLAFTHGIYGAGSNWRGIARKIVDARRDWGVVLVDLRAHGKSETGEPPHTIDACADDVVTLVETLRADGVDVRALAGHSFGGKVMLVARTRLDVAQTWLLDSNPSPRPGAIDDPRDSVVRVLRMLEQMPAQWATRDAFVGAVVAEGFDQGLAQWLATNRLDPPVLRELLTSYYATDAWPATGHAPIADPATGHAPIADPATGHAPIADPATSDAPMAGDPATDPTRHAGRLEVVVATASPVWPAADRERLAHCGTHVHVHEVTAGHWLHIEAAKPVVDLFVTELPV